jgi:hypothetical protein
MEKKHFEYEDYYLVRYILEESAASTLKIGASGSSNGL